MPTLGTLTKAATTNPKNVYDCKIDKRMPDDLIEHLRVVVFTDIWIDKHCTGDTRMSYDKAKGVRTFEFANPQDAMLFNLMYPAILQDALNT